MAVVLITSPESNSGKTMLAMALAFRLKNLGVDVRYARQSGEGAARDAQFVGETLGSAVLIEAAELTPEQLTQEATAPGVLLVEVDPTADPLATSGSGETAVLLVARYVATGLEEKIVEAARRAGTGVVGVVVNAIPEKGLRAIERKIGPGLAGAGVTLIASLPQVNELIGMTVGELADAIGATVLCASGALGAPVNAIMIGAMSDEGADAYFHRRTRKAVVVGGDRPDVHLPILQTDTSCIILTENYDPDPTVFVTAEQEEVPLLRVAEGTIATLDRVAGAIEATRFRQRHKLGAAQRLWQDSVNEQRFFESLRIVIPASVAR